ncbi:sulfurtransferase [Chryseobacterium sp. A301]
MKNTTLISAKELKDRLSDPSLVLWDARTGAGAKEEYLTSHLSGALFVDLNTDLSAVTQDPTKGGRHPLPQISVFLETVSQLGIGRDSFVVIYDTSFGANAAARAWWMLKAIGLDEVYVLDGGFAAGASKGIPLGSGPQQAKPAERIAATVWGLPVVSLLEVKKAIDQKERVVIDVREESRFQGDFEPIDLVAGHIPGALNVPFSENLDEHGLFLDKEILRSKYESILEKEESHSPIVHCGSGVTACHTILAMSYAGLEVPTLYVGSWSEWSRSSEPLATR